MRRHAKAPSGASSKSAVASRRILAGAAVALVLVFAFGVTLASAAAPVVTIEAASNVAYTSAKLKGEVNPEDHETSYHFEYATQAQFEASEWGEASFAGFGSLPEGAGATPVEEEVFGLAPGTTYHLRLVAENTEGERVEMIAPTFETEGPVTAPLVEAVEVSEVRYTTAHVSGEVTAGNADPAFNASCHFEYITDNHFHQNLDYSEPAFSGAGEAACDVEATGTAATAVQADLAELHPNATYHLRLVASNQGGTASATGPNFETEFVARPIVTTPIVTAITASGAHFEAEVNPNAPEAQPVSDPAVEGAWTTSWSFTPGGSSGSLAADNVPHPVEGDATGLEPHMEYTATIHATNAGGETTASETFTTDAVPPEVTTGTNTPHPVEGGTATTVVRGYVNAHNAPLTECAFEYSLDESYGQSAPCDAAPPLDNNIDLITATIAGLQPGATYHFRVTVETAGGTDVSDAGIFAAAEEPTEEACPNADKAGAGFLPDCRGWEQVSPVDKQGGEISASSGRTRSAEDGNAVSYISVSAFGDAVGTGIATDYIAIRTATGWRTHAITPPQDPLSILSVPLQIDATYQGEFSPDLSRGVFAAGSPVPTATDPHPNVVNVPNFYLRTDLRNAGPGSYELMTDCLACVTPLAAPTNFTQRPVLAWSNAGSSTVPPLSHAIFESNRPLTADAAVGKVNLYEYTGGQLRLAGRVPSAGLECDDTTATPCVTPPQGSLAGQGVSFPLLNYARDTVSADGERIFFMVRKAPCLDEACGDLYVRIGGERTLKLNVSEDGAVSGPAVFWDASADGHRVVFTTAAPLVAGDDNGLFDLYMYDADAAAGERLTRLSVDEMRDDTNGNVRGTVGASADGRYVYFVAQNQLVAGGPPTGGQVGLYLWHDGVVRYLGRFAGGADYRMNVSPQWPGQPLQSRVTPDGKTMIFGALSGAGFGGADHASTCDATTGTCEQLYVYSAESDAISCMSCVRPDGEPAQGAATLGAHFGAGTTQQAMHLMHALSDDGRHVFFNSEEDLVSTDTNGRVDAYEYDVHSGTLRLLSTGRSPSNSYFLDASPDGDNAFLVTREQLNATDTDAGYDLYDARVGGGFPPPAPPLSPCAGDTCREASGGLPSGVEAGSESFHGAGTKPERRCKHRHKGHHRRKRCARVRRGTTRVGGGAR